MIGRCTLAAVAALLAGCASHPLVPPLPQSARVAVPLDTDPETGRTFAIISVMTYNVAALPWPKRMGTGRAMRRIERAWPTEFAYGAPDVLVLQEAFVPAATALPGRIGYGNFVRGPRRRDRADLFIAKPDPEFRSDRRLTRGERLGKLVNSGLVAGTGLRIVSLVTHPFGGHSCAGFDCLANKGVQLLELEVPGMPEPLFILNTHLNSRLASGAPLDRSLAAYRRQMEQVEIFLEREWRGRGPLIWAGDFNARGDPERFEFKEERLVGEMAHRFCVRHPDTCVVTMSWDNDEPWLDTQDLQGFIEGGWVRVEPIAIRARFDKPVDGRMLSDHDGLEVVWKLSW
jgi:endonuclease/exonuclease/phosphatase family metal-dependent hydrolase